MTLRRPRRAQLRTRVLAGVLAVTVVALVAFDVAAVTALRRYLIGQTDARLQTVLSLYRRARGSAGPGAATGVRRHARTPAAPVQVRANWVIAGPRLRLSPPVLGQYYVGFVPGRGRRGFVVGNPRLVPQLPPGLQVYAAGPRSRP